MTIPVDYRRRGQAVWLDSISSKMILTGQLASRIASGTIYGVTSNPTIFGQAIEKNEGDYEAVLVADGRGRGRRVRDLRRADASRHRRRSGPLRRNPPDEPRGRVDLAGGPAGPRARRGGDREGGHPPLGPPLAAERLHQGPVDARGRPGDPAAHRERRLDQRHADVQPEALPRRRGRLPRRPRRPRGEREATSRRSTPSRRSSSRASIRSSTSSSTRRSRPPRARGRRRSRR